MPVAETDLAHWQQQIDVNLTAATRAGPGDPPRTAGGPRHGGAASTPAPAWLPTRPGRAYAASKFGVRALADALRAEEHEHGVRVTTVYPGRVATPMQEKVHAQEGKEYDAGVWIRPETVADAVLHALDLPADATVPDLTFRPGP